MVRVPKIKRYSKHQANVDRPVIITGKFDLHFEDIVQKNRFVIIGFVLTGLLAVAAFIPAAVYQSTADSQRIIIEAETGKINNSSGIMIVKGDAAAGGEGYIQFGQ